MDKKSILYVLLLTVILFFTNQWFSSRQFKQIQTSLGVEEKKELPKPKETTPVVEFSEDLYVLENDYQQLVFSPVGAALVEINLPFASSSNTNSIVKPISIDRKLASISPNNDLYPNYPAWVMKGSKKEQLQPKLGGYTPLLRRNIKNQQGLTATKIPEQFRGLTLNSVDDLTLSTVKYRVTKFTNDAITFETTHQGRTIQKTYFLPGVQAPYLIQMHLDISGQKTDLWLSTGIPEVELISGSFSPLLQYYIQRPNNSPTDTNKLPKTTTINDSVRPSWVCNSNGFFGIILDPALDVTGVKAEKVAPEVAPSRVSLLPSTGLFSSAPTTYAGYDLSIPLAGQQMTDYSIYAGPLDRAPLVQADAFLTKQEKGPANFLAAQVYHGWFTFITIPFAKFLFLLMDIFYKLTHSWGISIILLTIALRLMLYPLNAWSIRSMSKMQVVQPKLQSLQQKYKNDPKRLQMETVQLYRKEKVNPFSGCLPLFIQMPFLFGMFDLLKSSFPLRGAPFIPGWIDNLTAPDVLFSWHHSFPIIGNEFHLLPFIMGVVMFFQQRLSAPKDTSNLTEQQRQQIATGNIMSIFMIVIFYNMPSGLTIYFLSSTLLAILQQWYMKKRLTLATTG